MSKYHRGLEVDDLRRQMEAERRRATSPRRLPGEIPGVWTGGEALPPDVVIARLKQSAVIPRATEIPCSAHNAPAGEPCTHTVRGVCGLRLALRSVATR